MAEDQLFWGPGDELPPLDLFGDPGPLPNMDTFAVAPLMPDDSFPYEGGLPLEGVALNVGAVENPPPAPASDITDELLSLGTPATPATPAADGGSVDDEYVSSERASSGRSEQDLAGLPVAPGMSLSSQASDLTAGVSAVEAAKRKAEQIANDKASDRKRKSGAPGPDAKRQKGGSADGSSCSDGEGPADDAPEKVSHRKYQKRLQKNRDSAYVSRIRRREYARILEDSLQQVETEKNSIAAKYESLQRQFEVVCQELNSMKEATAARFGSVARSVAAPIGAAGNVAQKPGKAGALVTTMFVFAFLFGCMVPDSLVGGAASSSPSARGASFAGTNYPRYPAFAPKLAGNRGKVWDSYGPAVSWTPPSSQQLLDGLAHNVTQLLGKEHAGQVMQLLEQRVQAGIVSENALVEIARKARETALDTPEEHLPLAKSRRVELFQAILRKLASLADECFTKELIALVTLRIVPLPGKQFQIRTS